MYAHTKLGIKGEELHSLPLPWRQKKKRRNGVEGAVETLEFSSRSRAVWTNGGSTREEAGVPERKRARPVAEGGGEGDDGVTLLLIRQGEESSALSSLLPA